MVLLTTESRQPTAASRIFWIVALPLLALFLVAPFLFLALYDGPAPDDAILTSRLPVNRMAEPDPPELARFLHGVAEVRWTSISPLNPDDRTVGSDEHQLLQTYQDLLARFDALLAIDPQTWTWPNFHSSSDLQKRSPSRGAVRAAINLQLLRSRSESEMGNFPSAIRRCLQLTRFAHKLRGHSPSYYDLLYSMQTQAHVMKELKKSITHPVVSRVLIQESLETVLPLTAPSRDELILGIQLHYQDFKTLISDPAAQRQAMQDYSGRAPDRQLKIKVNQCLNLWLQDTAPVVEALSRSWPEGLSASAQLPAREAETSWREHIYALFSWNIDGRFCHQIYSINPGTTPLNVMEHDRLRNMTVIMMALRLHALRHGTLPNKLNELDPEILPEQPIDIFSGLPFQWDPLTQILSCQGTGPSQENAYWWRNAINSDR
jgi:hypothetical protein